MSLYRIARTAQRDLDAIWCYIGGFDVQAADRWLDRLEQRFRLLAKQPLAGQARPDLAPDVRFLPVGSYFIFYRPIEKGVGCIQARANQLPASLAAMELDLAPPGKSR